MRENAELDFGIVGPGALGKQVQNDFHQFIGVPEAKGWSSQLQQEFGAVLSYERPWRLPLIGDNRFGVDIVPRLCASIGISTLTGKQGIGRGWVPITDPSEYAPRCLQRIISTRRISTKGGAIFSPAHKGGALVVTSSSGATRFGRARASRRRSHRRRAGAILGPVVEIVAARHKRRAVHRGISRAANLRRHLHGGAQLYLVASARAGASVHTELAVTYRPAARGAPVGSRNWHSRLVSRYARYIPLKAPDRRCLRQCSDKGPHRTGLE